MSVLRRAYVEVEPDLSSFDTKLTTQLRAADPGGKAGKQIGGQLNRALKRFDLDPIDVKADPKSALAALAVTEHKLRELSGEAATVEVKVRTEKALGELGRFKKQLGDVGGDSGRGFAQSLSRAVSSSLASASSATGISAPIIAAVGIAAVAASPLLGAAISGAVIGGAGIGGVVGGLIVASKDVRVQAAGKELADGLQSRLERSAGAFVQPAIEGIHEIQGALDTIDIERIFRQSSQFVRPLVAGAASAITDVGNAIEKLVASAGPVIGVIGAGIAKIGKDLGSGLASLADNGAEASAALQTLFGIVGSSISTTLGLVNVLTELYGISHKLGFDTGLQLILKLTGSAMKDNSESAKVLAKADADAAVQMEIAADKAAMLAQQQQVLKAANDVVASAQGGLQRSLESLGGATSLQGQRSAALRTAMDNLYGATIRQSDANQDYEASWDSLSAAVKGNSRSLDIHTAAGRTNRDALKGLLSSTNELYIADINAGASIAQATKKHEGRITAIKEESKRLGLNTGKTQDLINTYGQIPKKKATDLLLSGVQGVVTALEKLYTLQRALALGININLVTGTGTTKDFKAAGGLIEGPGTATSDSVPLMGSRGEFMQRAAAVDYYGVGFMEDLNAKRIPRRELPGYAKGGLITPVDTSRRWPFTTNARATDIPSKAEAESKVIPAVPKGQTLDFMVRVVKAAFPGLGLISGFRRNAHTLSGALSYHALRRASDWPASRPLAEWINLHYKARTKELITPWNDLNIHNGSRHTYSGAVFRQHNFAGGNAHDHWAMANGGVIREPVFGVGASGQSYSFGERGPETVIPGMPAGGDLHVHIHDSVITSKRQAVDLFVEAYNTAKRERKIP